MKNKINQKMYMGTIIKEYPELRSVLEDLGMLCLGCPSSLNETIEDACIIHGYEVEEMISKLNNSLERNK